MKDKLLYMDKDKEEERRKQLIEKLDSLSTGKSSFIERNKLRYNLRRFTRNKYIEKRSKELYPLTSTKDVKSKLQRDAWVSGYKEALKVIIDYFEDTDIIATDSAFFANLQVLANKEDSENVIKYKKIFEDVINNFVLKRIKDDSEE